MAYIAQLVANTLNETNETPSYSRILNLGNENPVWVRDFVAILEKNIGKKAIINSLPMQPEDVYITYADTAETKTLTGYTPNTPLEIGLKHFIDWYKTYANTSMP